MLFPGLPGKDTKPTFWLTAEDIELTRKRMKAAGRAESVPWTRSKVSRRVRLSREYLSLTFFLSLFLQVKALFTSWHLYALPILYSLFNNVNDFFPSRLFVSRADPLSFFFFPRFFLSQAPVQQPMGFWLKSKLVPGIPTIPSAHQTTLVLVPSGFNATKTHPAPVPGRSYSISDINLLPLPGSVGRTHPLTSITSS